MNKTTIEWVRNPDGTQGYTWNVITGCLNHNNGLCKGGGFPCYAYKLAHGRLKQRYFANNKLAPTIGDGPTPYHTSRLLDSLDPFYPRFWERKLDQPFMRKKPSGIFPCDMGDLFGIGIPKDWTIRILDVIRQCPQHRFYLLTKQPQNLIKFSPFPENCWVGVTATNQQAFLEAIQVFIHHRIKAKVRYISFEPLLAEIPMTPEQLRAACDWLIIGACTGTLEDIKRANYSHKDTDGLMPMPYGKKWTLQPRSEWVKEIVEAADKAGVKVFLKDNLRGLLPKERPFYTKCCADVNGKDPCYEEPCLSEHLVDECSKAPNFWMLRQELPNGRQKE